MDRGGGEDVSEVGLGQAGEAGAADLGAADRLGDRALHAGTDVVTLLPLVGQLLTAPGFQRLLLVLGEQSQAAAPRAVRRSGALLARGATASVLGGEVHPCEGSSAAPAPTFPMGAGD